MNRIHALVVSLTLGAAGVVGAVAATQTIHLGAASAAPAQTDRAALRARAHRLNAWAKALNGSLAKRPPALPAVPRFEPVAVATYGTAVPVAATPALAASVAKVAAVAPGRAEATVRAATRSRPTGTAPPRPAEAPADEPATTTTQASDPGPTITPVAAPTPPAVPTTAPPTRGDDSGSGTDDGSEDPPEPEDG